MLPQLEGILNVVADVVDSACADIAACTLQLMGSLFHLGPVLRIQALSHLLDALVQRHFF